MKNKLTAIAAVLCTALLLCSCGAGNAEKTDDNAAQTTKPSDFNDKGDLVIVNYNDALTEAEANTYRNLYEADGMAYDNSYRVPALNVDLAGANALSEKIKADFETEYGTHFSMLDDLSGENVRESFPYIKYDYTYAVERDIVTVIITVQTGYPGKEPVSAKKIYYYDALSDTELAVSDYISYCGTTTAEIFSKLAETETVKSFGEGAAELPEGLSLGYVLNNGGNDFDCYLTVLSTGATEIVHITVDDTTLSVG